MTLMHRGSLINNIQMQCWQRGYQSFTHGGGASMILQTNDTEVHKPLRKEFCRLQDELVLRKTLNSAGGLKQCSDEENVLLLASAFSEWTFICRVAKAISTQARSLHSMVRRMI